MTKKNDKNNDYWRKRFLNIAKDQIIDTENFVKELQRQYNIAELQTKKDINYWYYRIAQNNNISMAEARKQLTSSERDEFNWSVWDYIKYAKENELNGKWVKELENASAKAHITRLDAINLQMKNQVAKLLDFQEKGLTKLISDVYTNGFYRTIYEHQKGIGEFSPFSMLDSQKIVELVKAPWSKDGKNFSQRIWGEQGGKLVSTLKNEFTNCVIRGDNPTTIAKMISNKFAVSRSSAERLVRTESAVFSSMATKKGYKSIGCEEFEVCAAFETRTCSDCGDRDGEHYPMSKYLVGSTAPPFHPNCRCTTVPYFSDEFTEDETKWSENGSVDGDLSFNDWKEEYLKKIPRMDIPESPLKKYTNAEINHIAREMDKVASKYLSIKSKWSGNIIVDDNGELYGKLWNCDIATMSETAPHIILHEHLHARSISYFDIETYREYRKIEEASVQLLAQEISKIENIKIIESQYDDMVSALRKINNKLDNNANDLNFAKQLLEIPVNERLDWLNNEIYTKTAKDISIKEFSELTECLNILC